MSQYHYQLNFAGAIWDIMSPMELDAEEKSTPFLTKGEVPDYKLSFTFGVPEEKEALIREKSPRVWKGNGYYRVERMLAVAERAYSCVFLWEEEPFSIQGLIYPGGEKSIHTIEKILDISELEILLSQIDVVSLHSSLVQLPDGRAILFTAPSGTGKSTQAELWEKYRNTVTINGDRSMIRKQNGIWEAYGSPFAGSSGIYRNMSAPIALIVVLRQAVQNKIYRIPTGKAFRYLYSETVMPRWNETAHNRIMDVLTQIIGEIPIVMAECTPDERAVCMVEQYLREECP